MISSVLAEQLREHAAAGVAAAAEPGIKMGEWAARGSAAHLWQQLLDIDNGNDDDFVAAGDRLVGAALGILVGQTADAAGQVGDPMTSIHLTGNVAGAQLVLSVLLHLYTQHERGISAATLMFGLGAADTTRHRVNDVISDDFDKHTRSHHA